MSRQPSMKPYNGNLNESCKFQSHQTHERLFDKSRCRQLRRCSSAVAPQDVGPSFFINVGQVTSEGLDFNARFGIDIDSILDGGRFSYNFSATHYLEQL